MGIFDGASNGHGSQRSRTESWEDLSKRNDDAELLIKHSNVIDITDSVATTRDDEWAMRRVPDDAEAEEDSFRCHGCNKETLDCHGIVPETGQRCCAEIRRGHFYPSIQVHYYGIKPEDLHKPDPPMETIPVMAYFCSMDCVNSVAEPPTGPSKAPS
eukprot:jgi/Mesvir1/11731/Mv00107-RA.1